MRKEQEIFTQVNKQNVPVSADILDTLEQEAVNESIFREYIIELLSERASSGEEEENLWKAFVGSGAQALELAEMTGHDDLAAIFHEIIDPIRERVEIIESTVERLQGNNPPTRKELTRITIALEDSAENITAALQNNINKVADNSAIDMSDVIDMLGANWGDPHHWLDSLFEMADYIWYHGIDYDSYNVASETKSKQDLDKIKMWAGVA